MGQMCCSLKDDGSTCNNRSKNYKNKENFFINSKGKCRSTSECEIRAHLSKKCYMKLRLDTVSENNLESSCTIVPSRRESFNSKFGVTMSDTSQIIDIKDIREAKEIKDANETYQTWDINLSKETKDNEIKC